MFLTYFLLTVIALILFDYLWKTKRYSMYSRVGGPRIFPVLGSLKILEFRSPKETMDLMIHDTNVYDRFSCGWTFYQKLVMNSRPKDLEVILSSTVNIRKTSLYDIGRPWLGDGLLLSTGAKWHARRKILTPAFHFKILEQFIEVFDRQSSILVAKLKNHADDQNAFNIYPFVTLATLDVICETSMGVKVNAQIDPGCSYVRAVMDVSEILINRAVNPWVWNNVMFGLIAPQQKQKQNAGLEVLHEFTARVIKERREKFEREKITSRMESETEFEAKKKVPLLDVLLQSTINGKPLSDSDIQEEVDTFVFEGHDTTASAISFTLYCISRHPDVQKKLYDEISNVIGKDIAKPITYSDLQRLKYTELVIKESMRMYSPVPVIGRRFTQDADINGVTVPAGTELLIPIFIIMKHADIFPEPETFDPERHNLENTAEKSYPFAYIPFSAGSRNCIGQKFAMLEMKSVISKVLRHYELLPLGEEPNAVMSLVMRSTNGINLGLKLRR